MKCELLEILRCPKSGLRLHLETDSIDWKEYVWYDAFLVNIIVSVMISKWHILIFYHHNVV